MTIRQLKNIDELKRFYNKLNGKYEGYIQLSDSRISHIFKTPTKLPDWDLLHNIPNVFIFEMVLFDPDRSFSIRVKQINDSWYAEEREVEWDANSEDCKLYYSVFDNHKYQELKMVQVWEEIEDPISIEFKTQVPVSVMFAGFEKGEKQC